jgi:hypothetical protein
MKQYSARKILLQVASDPTTSALYIRGSLALHSNKNTVSRRPTVERTKLVMGRDISFPHPKFGAGSDIYSATAPTKTSTLILRHILAFKM